MNENSILNHNFRFIVIKIRLKTYKSGGVKDRFMRFNNITNNIFMKKSILFLTFFFYFQANMFAQNIDLPIKQYLCNTGSVALDGTVLNTADTGITYQWYYSVSANVQVISGNEIAGATNPIYSASTASMGVGYYKAVATMSNASTVVDEVRLYGMAVVPTYGFVNCIDWYTASEFFEIEMLLENTTNVTYTYHFTLNEANTNINSISNSTGINYIYQLFLRIEETNGMCVDVIAVNVIEMNPAPWANSVSNMGSCSPNSTTNTFDLTTNDSQIIGGQSQMSINYFISYNDAWAGVNPISNPSTYTALSPTQTIYARVFDLNNPNPICDPTMSITQFQLLSAPTPTPNTSVDYVVCDDTSGTANDGIGAFDLTSKNSLVLAGLSASQFSISYHTTSVDAQNDVSPIVSPANYIGTTGEIMYIRVQSNVNTSCIQISQLNLLVQNTCEDIAVNLLSNWSSPRPGFSYINRLQVKNNGDSTVSLGTVEFVHDIQLIYDNVTGVNVGNTVTPTATGFTLDFINLLPGEVEEILIYMTVPPVLTLGDILTSTVTYTTAAADIYSGNDTSSLSEILIGSYDPNDITESHGPEILHATFTSEDYLYYTVRFQNVGTASAVNITIDNNLDAKLDKTTFEMISASHANSVERVFDQLTWQFNGINLADATSDEPNSHGYVSYKIKPLAGYSVGDIVPNTASIIFDFNTPVITNTFETEFVAVLAVNEFTLTDFTMYPNPTSGVLQINSKTQIAYIEVSNYLGQVVMKVNNQNIINISELATGLYFVKIKDLNGNSGIKKIVKK